MSQKIIPVVIKGLMVKSEWSNGEILFNVEANRRAKKIKWTERNLLRNKFDSIVRVLGFGHFSWMNC